MQRLDYPENNEEEANSYLTLTLGDDGIRFGRLPLRYWGNQKEQYEAHNPDYTGVYRPGD